MITVIRNYTKNGKTIILLIIIASFILGMLPMAIKEVSRSGKWAIKVNGQEVEYKEYAQEVDKQRDRIAAFKKYYGESADWLLSMMNMGDPRSMAFKILTRQELINQFADKLGVYLSPSYVEARLCDPLFITEQLSDVIPPQVVDPSTGINHAMLTMYLKHYGLTADILERQIERLLTDKIVMDIVGSSFYIPTFDVMQKFLSEFGKKSFSVFVINKAKLVAKIKNESVSDAALQQFYTERNQTAQNYWVPEKRSGMVWTFDPKHYDVVITDEQINNYYETNKLKKFIDEPATVQVRRILLTVPNEASRPDVQRKAAALKDEILQNPSLFATKAKEVSEDAETAKNGGLLQPFTRGSHEVPFERAAFILPQDGVLSDVIETSRGYEILQRVSKSVQTLKPLVRVKEEIRDELGAAAFNHAFTQDAKKAIDNHSDEALRSFIKLNNGKLQQLAQVAPTDSPWAAYLFKLEPNGVSFAIDGSGMGVIAQLTNIDQKRLPSLENIKGQVVADYQEHMALEEMNKKLKDAKAMASSATFRELQNHFEGDLIQTGWLDSSKESELEGLKKKGIPVDQMLQLEKSGSILTSQSGDNGYVIRLDEITPLESEEMGAKGEELVQNFKQERTQQYLEGFVASLYRNATIETNESVVTYQE
jgi:PPIC-type PPIASE domain.